jgi:putative colanic acid biosynthesis UDP-glucose lipid carrier transferase
MQVLRRGEAIRSLNASDSSFLFLLKTLFYPVMSSLPLLIAAIVLKAGSVGPYFLVSAITFLVSNLILDVALIHTSNEGRANWPEFFDICLRWSVVVVVVGTTLYAGDLLRSLDSEMLLKWALLTPLILWGSLRLAQLGLRNWWLSPLTSRKAVIIGAGEIGTILESVLRLSPVLKTELEGFFEDRTGDRIPHALSSRILGKSGEVAEYIRSHGTNVVYITIPMSRQQRILDLLSRLSDSTASIYFVPDLLTFNLIQARIDTLEGLPLIAVCESPFIGLNGLIKRVMDILLSGTLIAFATPIFLVVALGVWRSSPGPIILRQVRYGLDGRPIKVYKFRSMAVMEDGHQNYTQVVRNDPRVTPFGAFIRRTSLDELPQLVNVLEGSMSLVGPRPHVVAVNEQYRKLIPGYMIRHKVKPGITGLAQVNGFRGGDDIYSMSRRIEYDLNYLRTWSAGLDLSIILKTFLMLLRDKKAY